MNLRQKAKHFKKLYEDTLPKKPYPVIYEERVGKHYRVCTMVDERKKIYVQEIPQLLKTHIENSILSVLRPIISNKLRSEQDLDTGKITFYLDIWM